MEHTNYDDSALTFQTWLTAHTENLSTLRNTDATREETDMRLSKINVSLSKCWLIVKYCFCLIGLMAFGI